MGKTRELTPFQRRFVAEYLVDLNASAAVVRAGSVTKNPQTLGSQLLGKKHVAAAIARAEAKRLKSLEISAERVLKEAARLAFSDIRDAVSWDAARGVTLKDSADIPRDAGAAIREVQCQSDVVKVVEGDKVRTEDVRTVTKIKFHDKHNALNLLAKHLGLVKEVIEVVDSAELVRRLAEGRKRALG